MHHECINIVCQVESPVESCLSQKQNVIIVLWQPNGSSLLLTRQMLIRLF